METPTKPHPHHEPSRWENSNGWGARHINDTAPFTLWDPKKRQFRSPDKLELQWIHNEFGTVHFGQYGWYMRIEAEAPRPIPLTVGCMPVIFSSSGPESYATDFIPETPYPNPRIEDPCPTLTWPKMAFPTKEQNVALLTALSPLAHIRAILYLPNWTVVELSYGDGHIYEPRSLPGIVAGRTTLYHHGPEPFYTGMKEQTRARYIDTPNMLVSGGMIEAGSWSEADGLNSGLINLMAIGRRFEAPVRPPGHSVIPFEEWKVTSVNAIFGGMK